MTLLNEFEMIEALNCTRDQFIGYLDASVFAPCTDKKRGRPTKKAAGSAMYCKELVIKSVDDFQNGKFTPYRAIGATSESGETTSESRNSGPIGTSGELGIDREDGKDAGKVIRIESKKEPKFDFEKTFGKVETLKEVRAAILKSISIGEVPDKVFKKLQAIYLTLSKEKARREAKKNRVSKEKYEEDCQKVHCAWASAWSGDAGLLAAQSIIHELERITGKELQREFSNLKQIIHREIVNVSNQVIQPKVLAELEKL